MRSFAITRMTKGSNNRKTSRRRMTSSLMPTRTNYKTIPRRALSRKRTKRNNKRTNRRCRRKSIHQRTKPAKVKIRIRPRTVSKKDLSQRKILRKLTKKSMMNREIQNKRLLNEARQIKPPFNYDFSDHKYNLN